MSPDTDCTISLSMNFSGLCLQLEQQTKSKEMERQEGELKTVAKLIKISLSVLNIMQDYNGLVSVYISSEHNYLIKWYF